MQLLASAPLSIPAKCWTRRCGESWSSVDSLLKREEDALYSGYTRTDTHTHTHTRAHRGSDHSCLIGWGGGEESVRAGCSSVICCSVQGCSTNIPNTHTHTHSHAYIVFNAFVLSAVKHASLIKHNCIFTRMFSWDILLKHPCFCPHCSGSLNGCRSALLSAAS